MANQVVRQDFVLSQPGGLGSPTAFAGANEAVRITSSVDFQMHAFAQMISGRFAAPPGFIVSIDQTPLAGQVFDSLDFVVQPSALNQCVSLGCTAAERGETLVVRVSIPGDVSGKIKVRLMVITEPGATVSMVKGLTAAPNQRDPLHGRGELNP